MVELFKSSDWHGHLSNKISFAASGLKLKNAGNIILEKALPTLESLKLKSMERLFRMNNVSPIAEKVLRYDFSRGDHIRDVMELSSNTLLHLCRKQPVLFKELIKEYDLTPKETILYSSEVERLHDFFTLPLQGVFHKRLEIGGKKYHEDEVLVGVLRGDPNYDRFREMVFNTETQNYYERVGIKIEKLRQITEDAISGRTLLGQLLKKGNEAASFDWLSYTVRDFTELIRIFKIDENMPFEEKINLVVQSLLGVTNALLKGTPFYLPETDNQRKKITDLISVNVVKLAIVDKKVNGGLKKELKMIFDGEFIAQVYLMHMVLRLFFSGSPWVQGTENHIYSLFEKRFKNDKDKLLNLLLTKSENEILSLIRIDLDLTRDRKIDISKPKSVPRQLKRWRYTTIPKEGRIEKKFILKNIRELLVQDEKRNVSSFKTAFGLLDQLLEMIDINTPLFLKKEPVEMPEVKEFPSFEWLPKELRVYARDLYKACFPFLIQLLDKKRETEVLKVISDCFQEVMDELNLPSQPNERNIPGLEKIIRLKVQKLMDKRGIGKYFDYRFYMAEEMFGLSAPHRLKESPEASTSWDITDRGKIILALLNRFPDMSMFIVLGRAEDITGIKTTRFRRKEFLDIKANRFSSIRDWLTKLGKDENAENYLPNSDIDIVAVNGPGPDEMERYLKRLFPGKEYSIKKKTSSRRDEFNYLDIGTKGNIGKKNRSWMQIFNPVRGGKYKADNPLLIHMMEDASIENIVLKLEPYTFHKNGEKRTLISGMGMTPFRGYENLSKHRLLNQYWLDNPFVVAYYPFSKRRFLSSSFSQTLYAFRHDFRDWGYGGKHPIVSLDDRPITEEQLDDIDTLNRLAKETQEFFTYEVIQPIAEEARKNDYIIGYRSQRLKNGISILTDLGIAFDGDLASILRVLPEGESFIKGNKELFATNINVYPFGVFAEKGWFPEIGKLLENPDVLKRLKAKVFKYVNSLDNPPEKRYYHGIPGRRLFYDFLFELVEDNAALAFMLLRPIWCREEEWRLINNSKNPELARKLRKLDERFASIDFRSINKALAEKIHNLIQD